MKRLLSEDLESNKILKLTPDEGNVKETTDDLRNNLRLTSKDHWYLHIIEEAKQLKYGRPILDSVHYIGERLVLMNENVQLYCPSIRATLSMEHSASSCEKFIIGVTICPSTASDWKFYKIDDNQYERCYIDTTCRECKYLSIVHDVRWRHTTFCTTIPYPRSPSCSTVYKDDLFCALETSVNDGDLVDVVVKRYDQPKESEEFCALGDCLKAIENKSEKKMSKKRGTPVTNKLVNATPHGDDKMFIVDDYCYVKQRNSTYARHKIYGKDSQWELNALVLPNATETLFVGNSSIYYGVFKDSGTLQWFNYSLKTGKHTETRLSVDNTHFRDGCFEDPDGRIWSCVRKTETTGTKHFVIVEDPHTGYTEKKCVLSGSFSEASCSKPDMLVVANGVLHMMFATSTIAFGLFPVFVTTTIGTLGKMHISKSVFSNMSFSFI